MDIATGTRRVLIATSDSALKERLRALLCARYPLMSMHRGADVLAELGRDARAIVLLSDSLADMNAAALLDAIDAWLDANEMTVSDTRCIYLGAADAGVISTSSQSLFYAARPELQDDDLMALIDAAALGRAAVAAARPLALGSPAQAAHAQALLDAIHLLGTQREPSALAETATDSIRELIDADRAICLFCDSDTGILYRESTDTRETAEHPAALGMIGFAARTGRRITAAHAIDDCRYHPASDGAYVRAHARLIAQPVVAPDGQTHAVLLAIRTPDRPDFDQRELTLLAAFAWEAGPLLDRLSLRMQAEELLRAQGTPLFRREAMDSYQSPGEHGSPVRVVPAWVHYWYGPLLALLITALAYLCIGRVHHYASGPAVVRMNSRIDVTAHETGTIAAVHVQPGQHVSAGQILARFHDDDETRALEQLTRAWERELRAYLLDPGAEPTRRALASIRADTEQVTARREQRLVRAPRAGTVSDVRIRPGQHLDPGDVAMSLYTDDAELSVIAFAPGQDAPLIAPGMRMRLLLDGYRYAYQDLTITEIAREVIGPAEARRYVGPQLADSLPLDRSLVLVRATLPRPTFDFDGRTYHYYDGMPARVELRIRSQAIITALIPGLESL